MGKVKKKVLIGLIILFFVLSISFLLTPTIGNWIHQEKLKNTIETYSNVVSSLSAQDKESYLEEAKKYNLNLLNGTVDDYSLDYDDVLNFNDNGQIGTVSIPKINVNLPIFHGITDDVLSEGAGHMPETSFPVGGESTHSVISAHTAYPNKEFFDDLPKLEEGDTFCISVLGDTLVYEVKDIVVVDPDDVSPLEIERGKDLVSLLTCYPYAVNTHRIIVTGERIETNDTNTPVEVEDKSINPLVAIIILVGVTVLIVITFIIVRIIRKNKKSDSDVL